MDILARLTAPRLQDLWGQPVLVEFVAPDDEMVAKLTANKVEAELHPGRDQAGFEEAVLDQRFVFVVTPDQTIEDRPEVVDPPAFLELADALRIAAIQGCGLVHLPIYMLSKDLKTGRLISVLNDYEGAKRPIHAVYLHRMHLSAKIRTFVDFLYNQYQRYPDLEANPEETIW